MSYGYEFPPPRHQPPRSQGPSPTLVILLVAVVVLLAVVLVKQFWPSHRGPDTDPNVELRVTTPRGKLWDTEQAINDIYNKVSKSVAHISSGERGSGRGATGSGFIWEKTADRAYVVTNFHVVRNAAARDSQRDAYTTKPGGVISVTLFNQKSYRADIVGAYPDKDIAVL